MMYVLHPNFNLDCHCSAEGSKGPNCSQKEGICECKEGFAGNRCDMCALNHYGYPTCSGIPKKF